jgi:hypothetical protein
MGSVQSNVDCPVCGNPNAMEDFYYKSNEVYVFCNNCGYSYERTMKTIGPERKILFKCPKCKNEGMPNRKGDDAFCKKCNHQFTDSFLKYAVYDIRESRGKGSYAIAGILFKCPKCKQETCPDLKKGKYYCKSCKKVIDEKTVKEMKKRKKVSYVNTVCMIPDDMTKKQIEKMLKEIENSDVVVLVEKNIWDGKKI